MHQVRKTYRRKFLQRAEFSSLKSKCPKLYTLGKILVVVLETGLIVSRRVDDDGCPQYPITSGPLINRSQLQGGICRFSLRHQRARKSTMDKTLHRDSKMVSKIDMRGEEATKIGLKRRLGVRPKYIKGCPE
jgi:phage FluMu protein Com